MQVIILATLMFGVTEGAWSFPHALGLFALLGMLSIIARVVEASQAMDVINKASGE